jgi:hypothetical protein
VKIEVLYVADCPSHAAAVKLVRDVLITQGVAAEVHEVLVTDRRMADALQFPGSPTIRINGRDVTGEPPEGQPFALSCRLYPGSHPVGLPPEQMVRLAVMEAVAGGRK